MLRRLHVLLPAVSRSSDIPLQTLEAPGDEVAVLLLSELAPASVLWGWSRIVMGPRALRNVPGLRFAKVLGSGFEGGFGLKPSASRQGLFLVFSHSDAADEFTAFSGLVQQYRQRTREFCVVHMRAWSARGSWDGNVLPVSTKVPPQGPIAALTRASIHLRKAAAFWAHAPAAQQSLQGAAGCQLAVGLGEAPLLRQATFSIWDNVDAMDAYARSGAHLAAIQAAGKHHFFSESLFARFVPHRMEGVWKARRYG